MKIGFIGLGVMGESMAGHLLNAGHELAVYNRSMEKADELVHGGAVRESSVKSLAERSDIIFTILGYPSDVEEVYLGEPGLINHAKAGTLLVDMTTSSPDLAKKIYARAKTRRIDVLDAPVSGGDKGAEAGTLSIMVGGDVTVFEKAKPLFEIMGENIVYQGEPGCGQHCKMCNQITVAGNMLGVCESLAYAQRSGLDPATVLESISKGAAGSWLLDNLAPKMLEGDFDPGFFVKHFIKDMGIAVQEAERRNLRLPGLETALAQYRELEASGKGEAGTQALFQAYDV